MVNFTREILNPINLIEQFWPTADHTHIIYDPNFNRFERDYWVIRGSTHDGTLIFTYETLQRAFLEIMNKEAFAAKRPPQDGLKDIKYVVGNLKYTSVSGKVSLPYSDVNKYPGMKERVRMPVKVIYIY